MNLQTLLNDTLIIGESVKVKVFVAQSCLTLFDSMDRSPPGFSVHGILQAKIVEWVSIPSSTGYSWPRDRTCVSCIAGGFLTAEPPGKPESESENR